MIAPKGGQVDVCADVEIPQEAVGRLDVEPLHSIEGHLAADREGLYPIHIGSSSSQVHQSPIVEATNTPTEEQNANPPSSEQDQGQDQSRVDNGAAPSDVQDQVQDDEQPQVTEQAQDNDQDGDPHDQVDQEIPSRSLEDIEAHRIKRQERLLKRIMDKNEQILGDLKAKRTTRKQLGNFSSHHAYISMIEPKKVYEALEDSDWLEAMHEELNNFKHNKVWRLVERPKECKNVIGTKWVFKKK